MAYVKPVLISRLWSLTGFITDGKGLTTKLNALTAEDGITWAEKPWKTLDFSILETSEFELVEMPLHEMCEESYSRVKYEFEKTNFMILNPIGYATLDRDPYTGDIEVNMHPKALFCVRYEHLYYTSSTYKKNEEKTEVYPFIKEWLRDPEKRIFTSIGSFPTPLVCPLSCYNTFTGFLYQRWDPEIVATPFTETSPFYQHLVRLSGDDRTEEVVEFLLNYLAHLLQSPGVLPGVCINIKSTQGTGKNLFFETFARKVLGERYLLSTADSNYIVGDFNDLDDKFMVIFDEAAGSETYAAANKIKNYITAPTIKHQKKYVQGRTLKNLSRWFFFSNDDNSVKVETGDRRTQAINCTAPQMSTLQVKELLGAFNSPEQLKGFVVHLLERDISSFNPTKDRVKTDFYEALASKNLNKYESFVRELVYENTDGEDVIWCCPLRFNDLYQRYKKFCESKSYSLGSTKMFAMKLVLFRGVTKTKDKKGPIYRLNRDELLDYLVRDDVKVLSMEEYQGFIHNTINEEDVFVERTEKSDLDI